MRLKALAHQLKILSLKGKIVATTKIISFQITDKIYMQEIKISDSIYNEILSRKKGRESISKTLERELKPVKKCAAVEELERLRKEPGSKLSVVEKRLGL